MKTLLICHDGAVLDQVVLARWLSSFSELTGVVVIEEPVRRMWRRVRHEMKRIGIIRFFDIIAFRVYYRLFLQSGDKQWEEQQVQTNCAKYPAIPASTPVLRAPSPNTPEVEDFIRQANPDLVLARCKTLLKERIFSIPESGTFVMHPGICPEYRNAHGCFWALANGDLDRVGMTLLRIDKGVDTGPPFGYYRYPFDELRESHIVVQSRVVLENLDALREKLLDIFHGNAVVIDTSGRESGVWGQPWLTKYLHWKSDAKRRAA